MVLVLNGQNELSLSKVIDEAPNLGHSPGLAPSTALEPKTTAAIVDGSALLVETNTDLSENRQAALKNGASPNI